MRLFIATLLTLFGLSSAQADYAFVFTKSLCDNQADSMDAAWAAAQFAGWGTQRLFYFDGTNFQPVGHADAFDGFNNVVIAAHGDVGNIAGMSGATFATRFRNRHPTTPTNVFMMVCNSASAPVGKLSVLGALAAQYPGAVAGETAILQLTGATATCALTSAPPVPVLNIGNAVYRQNVVTSAQGDTITARLLKDWQSTVYPTSNLTFARYCRKIQAPALYEAFIAEVQARFMAPYLSLIRENGAGNALYQCGANTNTPVCQ